MSKPIRFLGFAVLTWAAVRAVSLGIVPGLESLAVDAEAAQTRQPRLPPIPPTALPAIEPVAMPSAPLLSMAYGMPAGYPSNAPYPPYAPFPVYVPVPSTGGRSAPPQIIYVNPPLPGDPREVHVYGAGLPQVEVPPKLALAAPVPQRQTTPSFEDPRRPEMADRLSMWFVDGQLAVTRPIWRNLSGGVGVWGGAQPGLNRFDAGPRLSLRLTPKIRAHFDYRYNVAGNAQPGSGAVMTLAGDF